MLHLVHSHCDLITGATNQSLFLDCWLEIDLCLNLWLWKWLSHSLVGVQEYKITKASCSHCIKKLSQRYRLLRTGHTVTWIHSPDKVRTTASWTNTINSWRPSYIATGMSCRNIHHPMWIFPIAKWTQRRRNPEDATLAQQESW